MVTELHDLNNNYTRVRVQSSSLALPSAGAVLAVCWCVQIFPFSLDEGITAQKRRRSQLKVNGPLKLEDRSTSTGFGQVSDRLC